MRRRSGSSMVEVDREKLVTALEEKLKNERNRIALETLQFNGALKTARKQYLLNLKAFMEKVAAGGEIPSDSYKLERIVEKGCAFPKLGWGGGLVDNLVSIAPLWKKDGTPFRVDLWREKRRNGESNGGTKEGSVGSGKGSVAGSRVGS